MSTHPSRPQLGLTILKQASLKYLTHLHASVLQRFAGMATTVNHVYGICLPSFHMGPQDSQRAGPKSYLTVSKCLLNEK